MDTERPDWLAYTMGRLCLLGRTDRVNYSEYQEREEVTPQVKLKRCAICHKLAVTTLILMVTSNGYRRVPTCATCARLGGKIVTK